jgi:hypothetical protein
LLLAGVLVIAGCGGTTTSIFYGNSTWTADGSVMCLKDLQSTTKDVIGSQTGQTITDSIVSMTSAGASETFQFDVTGDLPYSMTVSPTTAANQFVAYLGTLDSTTNKFGKVVIRNISTGTHRGLATVTLSFPDGIRSVDWSNTGTQIVYCTTNEVHTVNLDGTGDTTVIAGLTNVTFVGWKYGTRIAYVHTVGSDTILSLINANGTGNVNLAASASVTKPQISPANNNIIYGLFGNSFCSVDVSAGTPTTTEVVTNFKGSLPRLDPTGAMATYDKLSIEDSGVYVLNLSTKVETKIK